MKVNNFSEVHFTNFVVDHLSFTNNSRSHIIPQYPEDRHSVDDPPVRDLGKSQVTPSSTGPSPVLSSPGRHAPPPQGPVGVGGVGT